MKILYVGGYDNYLRIEQFKYMRSLNYKLMIASTKKDNLLIENGFITYVYSSSNKVSLLSDIVSVFKLFNLIVELKPDLIHSFDTKPNYLVGIALLFYRKPIKYVRTINGLGRVFSSKSITNKLLSFIYIMIHRLIKNSVNTDIFQNTHDNNFYLKNKLTSLQKSKLVKGSGISSKLTLNSLKNNSRKKIRKELGWDNSLVFLFLARLTKKKGIYKFINIAKSTKAKYLNSKFVVVGPTSEIDPSSIKRVTLERYFDFIEYLGYRNDVFDILSAADVYVLPSTYREGIPRTMLEAMAMEKMILVSDMPGCKEVVEDSNCGIVFNSKNLKGLSDAIETCFNCNLEDFGKRGRKAIIKYYSEEVIFKSIDEIYKNLKF